MNPNTELQQFSTKFDESQIIMIEQNKQKNKNSIECHCCKNIVSSKFTKVNARYVCFQCLDQISLLKVKYDLSPQSKLFQSPVNNYYCKLTMTPTSQFDFTISLCQICYQTKMLIKVCNKNHFFCETCISSFIQSNFDNTVNCFHNDCNENINYQLMYLYLEPHQLIKWIPITKQIHCIGQYCSGVWSVWPTYIQGNVEIISLNQCKCQLCHIQFCYKCRTIHTGLECSNEILLKNYLEQHKCFRCNCCRSLCQPQFCHQNQKIMKFKEWQYNIYECYVCKKQFCYDCQAQTSITLFSNSKCDNCINTYKAWKRKQQRIPKFKRILQLLFTALILVLYSIYSMIFIQIPQILDYFVNKIDPICESQDPIKIILLIINLPFIIIIFFLVYAITLIPLAIYNSFQTFIVKQGKVNNDI
ncbi:unnamed protein product [Paramecium pentaurelia]|uniref:RING-type domain-containing protein n=1 Tax=Paramecium pentaurelia TaxID=43138 RepID=A0A8S1SWI4_9CILI|nr:unnamed protein product [Paramecium pentaurelia]